MHQNGEIAHPAGDPSTRRQTIGRAVVAVSEQCVSQIFGAADSIAQRGTVRGYGDSTGKPKRWRFQSFGPSWLLCGPIWPWRRSRHPCDCSAPPRLLQATRSPPR